MSGTDIESIVLIVDGVEPERADRDVLGRCLANGACRRDVGVAAECSGINRSATVRAENDLGVLEQGRKIERLPDGAVREVDDDLVVQDVDSRRIDCA